MKIMINTSNIRISGILQVSVSFLMELKMIETKDSFHIIVSQEILDQIDIHSYGENCFFYEISLGIPMSRGFLKRIKELDKLEAQINPDIVFSLFGPTYWSPKSLHIAGFAYGLAINPDSKYLQSLSLKRSVKNRLTNSIKTFFFRKNANFYIAETEDVKVRLNKYLGISLSNIFVVSNTYSNLFLDTSLYTKFDLIKKDKIFKFITISSFFPHKNLEIINDVITELEKLGQKDFCFYLTIDKDKFSEKFVQNKHLINLGPVPPEQCPSLYFNADVMFLPTLLESFSATYPEAMVMKKPILTSDLSFAHAICGDAAVYFNPYDAKEIAFKIIKIMNDSEFYGEQVEKGILQLKNFPTARKRAEMYLSICNSLVDNSHKDRIRIK